MEEDKQKYEKRSSANLRKKDIFSEYPRSSLQPSKLTSYPKQY
jgi:hypothetical protein